MGGVFYSPFPLFPSFIFPLSFPNSTLFPHLEVVPQIQLRDLGSTVCSPSGETTCAATRHVTWALNTPSRDLATNAFLVYLEPKERVWWLQMAYCC